MTRTDIAREFFQSAVNADWDRLAQLLHPDFAVIESVALPFAGKYEGMDGFREIVARVFKSFDNLVVKPEHYSEGENHVVVLFRMSGTSKKNGQSFETEIAEVMVFEDEKIKTIKPFYWDPKLISDLYSGE